MKKFNYILLTFFFAIGMVSCQDDLIEKVSAGGADVNKPVKVNLKFNVQMKLTCHAVTIIQIWETFTFLYLTVIPF